MACAVVFIGTLAPIGYDALREAGLDMPQISVGPPFYDLAFTPFMVLLFLALPLGAMMPWKRGDAGRVMSRLWIAAALALVAGCAALVFGPAPGSREIGALAPIGIALAAWLVLGALVDLGERIGLGRVGPATALRRLVRLPGADWGKTIAHFGVGLMVFGIAALTAWEREDIRAAAPGDVWEMGGYQIRLDGVERLPLLAPFAVAGCDVGAGTFGKAEEGRNFITSLARFTVTKPGESFTMCAEKRDYPVAAMPTTEAAIDSGLTRDLYITLGDRQPDGSWAVRTYLKPFANWIWIGALVMAFGGLVSLADRRFRVGAVSRRAAPSAVPAE